MAEPFLEKNLHPTVLVRGYARVGVTCVRLTQVEEG
jgi:hypothetical protein